jgi:hypothetical protein
MILANASLFPLHGVQMQAIPPATTKVAMGAAMDATLPPVSTRLLITESVPEVCWRDNPVHFISDLHREKCDQVAKVGWVCEPCNEVAENVRFEVYLVSMEI